MLIKSHEFSNQSSIVLDGNPHPVIYELQHFTALRSRHYLRAIWKDGPMKEER